MRALLLTLLLVVSPVTVWLPAAVGLARSAAWNAEPVPVRGVEVVRQSEESSCGPAVVATLAAWAGAPVGERAVLEQANMRPEGVTLAEFARLAALFGAPGTWYRVKLSAVGRLGTPFVAQLEGEGFGHFVAVLSVRRGFAVVADPASGALAGPLSSVLPGFSGRVFVPRAAG